MPGFHSVLTKRVATLECKLRIVEAPPTFWPAIPTLMWPFRWCSWLQTLRVWLLRYYGPRRVRGLSRNSDNSLELLLFGRSVLFSFLKIILWWPRESVTADSHKEYSIMSIFCHDGVHKSDPGSKKRWIRYTCREFLLQLGPSDAFLNKGDA